METQIGSSGDDDASEVLRGVPPGLALHDLPIVSGRIPVPVSLSPAQSATRSSSRSSAGTSPPARRNRSAETWRTRHVPEIGASGKEAGKLFVAVYLHERRSEERRVGKECR